MKLPLSLTEQAVDKFFIRDRKTGAIVDDEHLKGLHRSLLQARQAAEQLLSMADAVASDTSPTPGENQRRLRKAAMAVSERAAAKLDDAMARADRELERIRSEIAAPPMKDEATEREVRSVLRSMTAKDRAAAIAKAITTGDDLTVGALLRGPALLSGSSDAERDLRRAEWQRKKHPQQVDRVDRLSRAVEVSRKAGDSFLKFVTGIADSPAAKAAEQSSKKADEALKSASQ